MSACGQVDASGFLDFAVQPIVIHDRGAAGFDRFSVNFRQMGEWYTSAWDPAKMDQWARLAELIRERNPKVIGINETLADKYGDGLTASLKARVPPSHGMAPGKSVPPARMSTSP